jgi:rhamnosyl/mannosyltransferase
MSRLSVLHAAKFYPPSRGGMETVIGDLCRGTARAWDVHVVAAGESRSTRVECLEGVHVVRAGSLGTVNSVPLCPTLPLHLWRRPVDCAVLHEPNPIAGTALALKVPARRLVVWHHSDLLRPWWAPHTYGRLQRLVYRRADCVIVSSRALAESSPLVREARQVAVVPFGIPLERFEAPQAGFDARVRDLRAGGRGPRVLFVGRFVYYKGLDVLLDAMASCRGELWLVGDGPLEPSLRARAAALGLADRVRWFGRVDDADLPPLYRAADIFVLPSVATTETFGVVQIEAMASGLPVISTNLPTGVPWVNQDGATGLVVPPAAADALAAAIRRLEDEPALRRRFARNAAARARTHFSRERMVAAFARAVEEVVDRQASVEPLVKRGGS